MKRSFLLFAVYIFLACPCFAIEVFEYDKYLEKVSSKPQKIDNLFKNQEFSEKASSWLSMLDGLLDPEIWGRYDASFFLRLSKQGEITAIAIDELRETNPEKFKNFIAKLLSIKFPNPPEEISSMVLNLDARNLYIDRPIENFRITDSQYHKLRLSSIEIDSLFDTNNTFNLIEPGYIDYPTIGETFIFSNDFGNIMYAKVINTSKKDISLLVYKMVSEEQKYHLNWSFNIKRPKKNSRDNLKTVLESGVASATLAGTVMAISSDGIAPGLLSLLGTTGAVLEEHEKIKSFDFVRGDKISLTRLSDK